MDYSKIHIAERILETAGIAIPESENKVREKAYKQLVNRDFLAAHSIRLGKDYRVFTKENWQEVIQISGKDTVNANVGAYALCIKHGLI